MAITLVQPLFLDYKRNILKRRDVKRRTMFAKGEMGVMPSPKEQMGKKNI